MNRNQSSVSDLTRNKCSDDGKTYSDTEDGALQTEPNAARTRMMGHEQLGSIETHVDEVCSVSDGNRIQSSVSDMTRILKTAAKLMWEEHCLKTVA